MTAWLNIVSGTYTLCSTHQPQWGSPDPRQAPQEVYCSQLSTGTRVTWNYRNAHLVNTGHTPPPSNSLYDIGRMCTGSTGGVLCLEHEIKGTSPLWLSEINSSGGAAYNSTLLHTRQARGGEVEVLNTCKHTHGLRLHPLTNSSL